MSERRPRDRRPDRAPPVDRAADDVAAFDRWLADGLAPDAHDRAAGQLLAHAWHDRRRTLDAAVVPATVASLRRHAWWWAPLAVATIAALVVVSWPTQAFVDGDALASAYLDAMVALPVGAP